MKKLRLTSLVVLVRGRNRSPLSAERRLHELRFIETKLQVKCRTELRVIEIHTVGDLFVTALVPCRFVARDE